MTADERPMPADGAETGGYIVVPPDFVETLLRFLDHRVFATPRVPPPGPTIPQSYDEYLRVVRAQEERDRGRFMGTAPAADDAVYDARSGQAMLRDDDAAASHAPGSLTSWRVRTWRAEDRDEAGDLLDPHRSHLHAVDVMDLLRWNESEVRVACRVCWTLDVCVDGLVLTTCCEHEPVPRTRVFVGEAEKPPPCSGPHK